MTTMTLHWYEPAGCTTPRGWLRSGDTCIGNYLDYGPGHYRSPHSSVLDTINGQIVRVWCQPDRKCPTCQPGNIHAMRYPGGPGTASTCRYFETVAEARDWIAS